MSSHADDQPRAIGRQSRGPPADDPLDQVVVRALHQPAAAARRASERSRPSSSSDSNSGGDTFRPVTAIRTGPKATPRLELELLDQRLAQRGLDARRSTTTRAPTSASCAARTTSRPASSSSSTCVERRLVDEQEAEHRRGLGELVHPLGDQRHRQLEQLRVRVVDRVGETPAACRNGTTRWVSSSTGSIRMWSALIASAFLRSKRAGLGFTSLDVEGLDHLGDREDVAVRRDRPAEQGEVVEQPLGQEAVGRGT